MERILEQERWMARDISFICFEWVKTFFGRAFGCWHRQLSLPFTRGNETYRTCVACGARRRFDREKWTMVGSFYRY